MGTEMKVGELNDLGGGLRSAPHVSRAVGPVGHVGSARDQWSTPVEVITDAAAIAATLTHYVRVARREVLTVSALSPVRADEYARVATRQAIDRGASMRCLCQTQALHDSASRSYLSELCARGGQVRLNSAPLARSAVVDRQVGLLLGGPAAAPPTSLTVVRDRGVIAWMVSNFEQTWTVGTPFNDALATVRRRSVALNQTGEMILRLMAQGEKDEAISRRLSISVRTCRRHIAEYMTQVGATSRFQAGVIAAGNGHLDLPADPPNGPKG
jgi:DNA-binding CsgD family transcriptional regulator